MAELVECSNCGRRVVAIVLLTVITGCGCGSAAEKSAPPSPPPPETWEKNLTDRNWKASEKPVSAEPWPSTRHLYSKMFSTEDKKTCAVFLDFNIPGNADDTASTDIRRVKIFTIKLLALTPKDKPPTWVCEPLAANIELIIPGFRDLLINKLISVKDPKGGRMLSGAENDDWKLNAEWVAPKDESSQFETTIWIERKAKKP